MRASETFVVHTSGQVWYLASNGTRVLISEEGYRETMMDLNKRAWVVERTIAALASADPLEAALSVREAEAPR